MALANNPALTEFVRNLGGEFVFGQVIIRYDGSAFDLRHLADRETKSEQLQSIASADSRVLSQFTANGTFRPLKSSPDLRTGWIVLAKDERELEFALNQLYPAGVADWFAVRKGGAAITNYREFTGRQTGMYRVTTMLSDAQAAHVIRACCNRQFCLKQRLWSVAGLPTDPVGEKSAIPCLEPCAILLEFARKSMRIEQEEKGQLLLSSSDAVTIEAVLEFALKCPATEVSKADFASPLNLRRIALALEKLRASGIKLANTEQEE